MKFRILIQEYLRYTDKPVYGKARQLTIATDLNLDQLRDKVAKCLDGEVRDVGRPKQT